MIAGVGKRVCNPVTGIPLALPPRISLLLVGTPIRRTSCTNHDSMDAPTAPATEKLETNTSVQVQDD